MAGFLVAEDSLLAAMPSVNETTRGAAVDGGAARPADAPRMPGGWRVGDAVVMPVAAAATRPLRLRVLRPGRAADAVVFPGDDASDARHVAARAPDGALLAVGSVVPEPAPWDAATPAWRVRGMATAPG